MDLGEYGENLVTNLSEAWETARTFVKKSQQKQKNYDKKTKVVFRVGDRVFLHKSSAKVGKAYKFARPFHGPYRILELTPNDARLTPVDKPQEEPVFVALDRLRKYPDELEDTFWPTRSQQSRKKLSKLPDRESPSEDVLSPSAPKPASPERVVDASVCSGRLRRS